ncbi:GspH/FimT family pseudopilin [Halorhodospira abdelmalekii]|uniref:GspH/FimT family pseudopilin n=1 Tax=Halorhodospira abdelmalekii TaxID=421629 RepID=UPI001903132F
MPPLSSHRSGGLTLFELLTVVALIAVLTTWALPQWQAASLEVRAWLWQRELAGALERARLHTATHGVAVTLCGGGATTGCDPDGWSSGWLLFEDRAGDRACSGIAADGGCSDHGGRVLEVGAGVAAPLVVTANHTVRSGVRYSPEHWGVMPGSFALCAEDQELARLILSRAGRVRRAAGDPVAGCG